ncbi:MAG: DUF3237 domain-containing protein [Nostoc sp.]|uniref:DUF3237 domain-containing protein n=1 Tax=Nostoc sp. TaxID=1180 RepID=UPI002FF5F954
MPEQSLQLVHEFTFQVACSHPHEAGAGPYGNRQYYELTGGRIEGSRLNGKLLGSGSDWMLTGPDGYIRMDVRVQIETEDGAVICVHYFGPAEANEKLRRSVTAIAPTAFADQSIHSHWVLETGDPRYAWINQAVFVGHGRLLPAGPGLLGFEHWVYRLS